MNTHNMLEVSGPNGYFKRYVNGKPCGNTRWHLIQCHARMGGSLECFTTTRKGERYYRRHVARTRIDFSR